MPVTRQEYTVSATWTPAQAATAFRSAFIDAGYMTEWYDSFLSGTVENRVLEVQYDATKTYGKTYYWFMFDDGSIVIKVAYDWNTTTKTPAGTQYLDFFNSTTNSTSNTTRLAVFSTTVNFSLIRFTSQASATHTWFVIRQGTAQAVFTISQPAHQVAPWIDLSKSGFHHFLDINPYVSSLSAGVAIHNHTLNRRTFGLGSGLKVDTDITRYYWSQSSVAVYGAVGRGINSATSNWSTFPRISSSIIVNQGTTTNFTICLPVYEASVVPSFSADVNPIYTCLPTSFYMTNSNMPSDLGIVFYYADNIMVRGDKFIVNAGIEEWEILDVANNATKTSGASAAVVARII
jgi:hypothetical protein